MTKLCMCGHGKGSHDDNHINTEQAFDGNYLKGICYDCDYGMEHLYEYEYNDPSSWTCD